MSSETPNIETYLHVKEFISNYKLGINITSKPLKNKMIEVNTILKFEDPNETNDLGKVTADCQFCGAKYILSPSELGYRN